MSIKAIGIDLAKSVFQVCVLQEDGSILWNRKVKREKLLHTLRNFPAKTLVAMESCARSHYWGRRLEQAGYQVKLIPAQHVKPMVSAQKNDANDALAICEAAFRPKLHSVPIKTVEQQDIKALRCVRQRMVEYRTALACQMRGLAGEYGVNFGTGIKVLRKELPDTIEDGDNDLSVVMRGLLLRMQSELRALDEEIKALEQDIHQLCKQQPRYQLLQGIPGFGPIVAAAFVSEVGDGLQFSNGRQLSAWCGLVPKQRSTGGKTRLGSITKAGNKQLRVLLIHGARAVFAHVSNRNDRLGRWLNKLIVRRGKRKAIVALANKLARIAWSMTVSGNKFELTHAFAVTK
ncbi:IS110 family transposase [Ferrimonas sp. SCSIO 43195]|uniref:IS110 family transposase n=2 Tax=Ferrimonas TaxID=44011 RepID=UPI002075A6B1|nr:IS110 family transposase [Ferrimonas sp. SCSIO 43195]USD36567.1 IS110 family transposase [Ferrimonas sp. SCSIO 43195]USD39063.1 IS110 family transposase [Ferrimonas sp. SCSIO 43195]USD39260.1 IS110 family transposase [Ferrimonas sp. SCSIO 43195]